MIQFSAVTKRYPGGHEALRGITAEVAAGEMVAVTGHSGAGKSTLLKLAAGIERATAGSVVVNGQNLGALGESALAVLRRRTGFVFQDHKLLYDRSCHDNVALPLRLAGFSRAEAGRRVRAALDKVGLLGREKAMPIALSGGEQQRLCIARAIALEPEIILLDEPCSGLDPISTLKIEEAMASLKSRFTWVIVTNNTKQAARVGDRTAFFLLGELVEDGPTDEIFTNPVDARTGDYIEGRFG